MTYGIYVDNLGSSGGVNGINGQSNRSACPDVVREIFSVLSLPLYFFSLYLLGCKKKNHFHITIRYHLFFLSENSKKTVFLNPELKLVLDMSGESMRFIGRDRNDRSLEIASPYSDLLHHFHSR